MKLKLLALAAALALGACSSVTDPNSPARDPVPCPATWVKCKLDGRG